MSFVVGVFTGVVLMAFMLGLCQSAGRRMPRRDAAAEQEAGFEMVERPLGRKSNKF